MSSLVDELDDDDIEASLLWTDDEDGDPDNIDPLDEELLLNDPVIKEEVSPQKGINSKAIVANQDNLSDLDISVHKASRLVDSTESVVSQSAAENISHSDSFKINDGDCHNCSRDDILETTLTDEFVDLNVTINTRDALETSIVENNVKCLNETVCQELFNEPVECSEVEVCVTEMKSRTVDNDGIPNPVQASPDTTEGKPVKISPSSISETCEISNDEINMNSCEDGKTTQVRLLINGDKSMQNNHTNTSEQMIENETVKNDDQEAQKNLGYDPASSDTQDKLSVNRDEDLSVIDSVESSLVAEDTSITKSSKSKHLHDKLSVNEDEDLTVIDSVESSLVAEDTSTTGSSESKNVLEVPENSPKEIDNSPSTTPTNKHDAIQSGGDVSVKNSSPIDAAIKNIRQAVSKTKRAQSLPDGEEPAQKRFRHSSEPVSVGSATNNENKKSVENDKSTTNILPSETLKLDLKKGMADKKKSIITFDFHHYCKEASTDPYICKTCSGKFKDESKFETHLVANHAMALSISHFNIDLHQYYRQKKEKAIAQSKSVLPRLDGNVDKALITEYNQNVKLITAQKNIQFFCKKCENIYSTKNLIIEHLKSPKHLLLKKM